MRKSYAKIKNTPQEVAGQPAGNDELELNKDYRTDVEILERAKRELLAKYEIAKSELRVLESELHGLESSVYAFFKADALSKKVIVKGQKIEFLGNFKYKIVSIE